MSKPTKKPSLEKQIDEMKKYARKLNSSRTESKEFLKATGIYTPTGKLKNVYR